MRKQKSILLTAIISLICTSIIFSSDFTSSVGPSSTWFTNTGKLINRQGYAASICDMNNDWIPDMVFVNNASVDIVIQKEDPISGIISPDETISINDPVIPHRNITAMGLHDINQDGLLDLYLGYTNSTDALPLQETLINNGDGKSFSRYDCNNQMIEPLTRSIVTRSILFADFNGDTYFDSFHSMNPYSYYYKNSFNRLHPGTADWKQFGANESDNLSLPSDFWHHVGEDIDGFSNKLGKGTVIRDFNNDGKPDLVFGTYADITVFDKRYPSLCHTWEGGLFVLQNKSTIDNFIFEDVQPEEHKVPDLIGKPAMSIYSVVPADFDLDGDLDLFIGGVVNNSANKTIEADAPVIRIYRNDSTLERIYFEDITEISGLNKYNELLPGTKASITLAASAPVDIDNDGFVDIVSVNRLWHKPHELFNQSYVFKNIGTKGQILFEYIPSETHGINQLARGIAYGDVNNDGLQDILIVDGKNDVGAGGDPNGEKMGENEYRLYYNQYLTSNNYIKLDLRKPGNASLVHAIGSKVTIYKAGTTEIIGYDEVRTDYCYRSKRSPMLHFGLGNVTSVDVSITTRYGKEFSYKNLSANKIHGLLLWSLKNKQEVFFSF